MSEQNRTTLKSYFQAGDRPTEQQFIDLIDSMLNRDSDNIIGNIVGEVGSVSSLDNLSLPSIADGLTIKLGGYHVIGDGGGGDIYWDANEDKQNHNGGTIISPTWDNGTFGDAQDPNWFTSDGTDSGTGCWKRPVGDKVDIRHFGAVGDNSTISTESIKNTLIFCKTTGIECFIPEGIFLVGTILTTLNADEELIIKGQGKTSLIRRAPNTITADFQRTFIIDPSTTTDSVEISNIYFDGNRRNQDAVTAAGPGSFDFQQTAIIHIRQNYSNVHIHDCWFTDPTADCIWLVQQNYANIHDIVFVERNGTRADILLRDVRGFDVNNIKGLNRGDVNFPSRVEMENDTTDPNIDQVNGSFSNMDIGRIEIAGPFGNKEYLNVKLDKVSTTDQWYTANGTFVISNSDLIVGGANRPISVRRLRQCNLKVIDSDIRFQYDATNETIFNLRTVEGDGVPWDIKFIRTNFYIVDEGTLTFSSPNDFFVQLWGEDNTLDSKAYFENCTFDERIPVCISNVGRFLETRNNAFSSVNYGVRVSSRSGTDTYGIWHSYGDTVSTGGMVTFGNAHELGALSGRIKGEDFVIHRITLESPANFNSNADVQSSRKIKGSDPTGTQGFEGDEVTVVDSGAGTVTKYVATITHSADANWVTV